MLFSNQYTSFDENNSVTNNENQEQTPDTNLDDHVTDNVFQLSRTDDQTINMMSYWKSFRLHNLENEINNYLKQMENQMASYADLTDQFKNVQQILAEAESTQTLNKSCTIAIIESFQNQLIHLLNRITISENFVLRLAKFFNFLTKLKENESSSLNATKRQSTKIRKQIANITKTTKPPRIEKTIKKITNSQPTISDYLNNNFNNSFTVSNQQNHINNDTNEIGTLLDASTINLNGYSLTFSQINNSSNININNNNNNNNNNNSSHQISDEINADLVDDIGEGEDDEIENGYRNNSPSLITTGYQSAYILPYDLTNVQIPENETTEQIAKKLKEFMILNKISQRNLAENLLNMKQANLSALLSQPMCWEKLSKTSKERFLIMYLWLNDTDRMEKLCNGPKNKLSLISTIPTSTQKAKYFSSSNTNHLKVLNSSFDKKNRVSLSQEQKEKLANYFIKNPYPSSDDLELIATDINIPAKKVSNWFINHRSANKNLSKSNKKT